MKSNKKQFWPLLLLIASCSQLNAQTIDNSTPKIDYTPFATDALFQNDNSYSHTLGWSLFHTGQGNTKLYEAHATSSSFFVDGYDSYSAEFVEGNPKLKKIDKEEVEKLRLDTTLAIGELSSNGKSFTWDRYATAVLARLRDSFQMYNDASPGLNLNYKSFDGEEDFTLKGALMVDIYPAFCYASGMQLPGFSEPHRFWLRTGVETDKNGSSSDLTSYYLLLNAQANPDLNQRIELFGGKAIISSPQLFQFGIAFDDDRNTGERDTRFLLSWQPALYLPEGFTILDLFKGKKNDTQKPEEADESRQLGSGFGINHKMYFRTMNDSGPFSLYSPFYDCDKCKKSDWYTYIPMNIDLSSSSEILKKTLADRNFGGATIDWNGGFGIGSDKFPIRLTYMCEGKTPLSNMVESRIANSLTLTWSVGMTAQDRIDADGKNLNPDEVFSGLTLNAKYTTGEFDDHVGKHDEFTVGTNLRF